MPRPRQYPEEVLDFERRLATLEGIVPASGLEVVFADLGPIAGSALDISETTDVTIVTTDIADVVVGDVLIARLWGTILNGSGGTRTYTFTPDFDAAFDPENAIPSVNVTGRHPVDCEWMLAVVATNDARFQGEMSVSLAGNSTGAWSDVTTSFERTTAWDHVATDLTGTVTVSLAVRSNSAAATQEFLFDSFVVRKIGST